MTSAMTPDQCFDAMAIALGMTTTKIQAARRPAGDVGYEDILKWVKALREEKEFVHCEYHELHGKYEELKEENVSKTQALTKMGAAIKELKEELSQKTFALESAKDENQELRQHKYDLRENEAKFNKLKGDFEKIGEKLKFEGDTTCEDILDCLDGLFFGEDMLKKRVSELVEVQEEIVAHDWNLCKECEGAIKKIVSVMDEGEIDSDEETDSDDDGDNHTIVLGAYAAHRLERLKLRDELKGVQEYKDLEKDILVGDVNEKREKISLLEAENGELKLTNARIIKEANEMNDAGWLKIAASTQGHAAKLHAQNTELIRMICEFADYMDHDQNTKDIFKGIVGQFPEDYDIDDPISLARYD